MKVQVLALDGVFDTRLATVLDSIVTANELAEMTSRWTPRFEVTVAGVQRAVKTSLGLAAPVRAIGSRSPD
jgi:hypothetical protein